MRSALKFGFMVFTNPEDDRPGESWHGPYTTEAERDREADGYTRAGYTVRREEVYECAECGKIIIRGSEAYFGDEPHCGPCCTTKIIAQNGPSSDPIEQIRHSFGL